MAVSFVGHNGDGTMDGTGSSLTFQTTRTIQAGEHVIVSTGNSGGSNNTSTITVGALSLALDRMGPNTTTHLELWSARATAQIASGSNVVITQPGNVTNSIHGICFSLGGIAATTPLDVTQTGTGSGTSTGGTTNATATTAQADSMAIGLLRLLNSALTPIAAAGGYTQVAAPIVDTTAIKVMQAEYLILSAIGTPAASWTWSSGTAAWDGIVAVYKGEAAVSGGDAITLASTKVAIA